MKFCIEMIYDNLEIEDTTLISQHKTDFLIENIKRYKESQAITSDSLYIVTSGQLQNVSVHSVTSFICIGSINDIPLDEPNFSLILVPPNTDITILFEKIIALFDRFIKWEQEAYTLILKKCSLQDVLNFCSLMLENPVALFDHQQALILKSGNLPPDRTDIIWKHVLKTGQSPHETPSSYLAEQLYSSAYPFFYNSDNEYRNINRMLVRVRKENAPFGCLSMTDVLSPFTATEYTVLFYIAKITELHLLNSNEFKLYNSDTPWFLTQLFQGNLLDPKTIRYNISLLGISSDTPYQIWVFTSTKEIDLYYDGGHLKNIKLFFGSPYIYIYKNEIIVLLLNPAKALEKNKEKKLNELLVHRDLRCACSMSFTSFTDIYTAYMQCQTLLEKSTFRSNSYLSYNFYFIQLIYLYINDSCNIETILYPNIRKILSDTNDYGFDLISCLKTYIINGKNVSTTANALGIHRHTVIYRLERISNLLLVDLRELDENSLFHIYVSCQILLVNHLYAPN